MAYGFTILFCRRDANSITMGPVGSNEREYFKIYCWEPFMGENGNAYLKNTS
jgi:hypothetical protein